MAVLENQKDKSYALYWDCHDSDVVRSAMLFYTEDGALVAGLAVTAGNGEAWLRSIAEAVHGSHGYVSFDSPPPETRRAFLEVCSASDQARMISGNIKEPCL